MTIHRQPAGITSDLEDWQDSTTGQSLVRFASDGAIFSPSLSVTVSGADRTGVTDSTAAVQAAASALTSGGTLFFPAGTFKISAEILLPDSKIRVVGAGRDVTVVNQVSSSFAFAYRSPVEITTSTTTRAGPCFEHLSITARNAIDLNQSGTFSTVFDRQGFLTACSLRHVSLLGDYTAQADANRDTATVSSQATLDAFGIGVRAAKAFNTYIGEGVMISGYGTGVRFDGADNSVITDSARFLGNARHIYGYGHDSYGNGVKILTAELLVNRRAGGVFLDGTISARIRDSYMEATTAAGLYVLTSGDALTHMTGCRIADPINGTPVKMFSFAPTSGLRVEGNTYEHGASPSGTVELLNTNWGSPRRLATFANNGDLPGPGTVAAMVPAVASATSMALPDDGVVHGVSGTTTIDNLLNGWPGREVTLRMLNGATMRHFGGSGNLRLAGAADFVGTSEDTITFVCAENGVWYEKSRAVI